MRFIVDAQLPPALARWLAARGHEAFHVSDLGLRDAGDTSIWQHAIATQAVILTKDDDFAHRFHQGGTCPIVVWFRLGNTSRQALLVWFDALLPKVEQLIASGERFIEIR
ncbi:MAG: DUF5615 family PIN-like protein [Luteolibacter sp.]